jgi:hypothetical protein
VQAIEELKQAAEAKWKECDAMSNAYAKTLSALFPANLIFVVGAALLSLIAGASLLVENDLLTKTGAGVLALVSGGLTIIHSKLECESYQAECRKLLGIYRGIAQDYKNLNVVDDVAKFKERLSAIDDRLSATLKTCTAWPILWKRAKA